MSIQGISTQIAKGQLTSGQSIIIGTNPAKGTVYVTLVTGAGATATFTFTYDNGVITDDDLVFASGVNVGDIFFSPLAANSNVITGLIGPTTGISIASAGGTTDYTVAQWPNKDVPGT